MSTDPGIEPPHYSVTLPMDETPRQNQRSFGKDFKRFFFRGLAIILPTVATFALLIWVYSKIQTSIAEPINAGLRAAIVHFTDWPEASDDDFIVIEEDLPPSLVEAADSHVERMDEGERRMSRRQFIAEQPEAIKLARRHALKQRWDSIAVGNWHVLDLIGLVIAIILIYIVGVILGSYIGRRLYARGESLIDRVPLIRRIYPAFKQIVDFIVPDDDDENKMSFSRVVAVQYPRKGIWSVGLVTGDTMRTIQDKAGSECMTIFIPSSPTPFTGYVITVPEADVIDLPITIEDALKFAVSGGVLVPPNQQINQKPEPVLTSPANERSGGWRRLLRGRQEPAPKQTTASDSTPEPTPPENSTEPPTSE